MGQKNIFIIIITAIFIASLVGGGVYFWQQSILEELKIKNQQQINDLNNQLAELQQQMSEVTEEKDTLQQQLDELTKVPERYVKIISPNGGEKFCLNDNLAVEWESRGVEAIGLKYYQYEGYKESHGNLDSYPATYNETGEPGKGIVSFLIDGIKLHEGVSWKIKIISADGGTMVEDFSDAIFSITKCEG